MTSSYPHCSAAPRLTYEDCGSRCPTQFLWIGRMFSLHPAHRWLILPLHPAEKAMRWS